jgi:hypothetical protein
LSVDFKHVKDPTTTGGTLRDLLEEALGAALIQHEFETGESQLEGLTGRVVLLSDASRSVLGLRISETDLSPRAQRFITEDLRVQTVKRLRYQVTAEKLYGYTAGPKSIRGFGRGTANEIVSWMREHQLFDDQ